MPSLSAPNGLTLSKSATNPNSRLNQVRRYLSAVGTATREEILRDVFRLVYRDRHTSLPDGCRWGSDGHHCYLFSVAVGRGYLISEQMGRQVRYRNNPDR